MPADFDTSEYALGVFQMFDTYKSEKITLIVENALMKYIIDQFGIDVHTEKYDDNHFSAQVTVSASPNFFRWVFGWNGKIVIKSPQNVLLQYYSMICNVIKSNGFLENFDRESRKNEI